MMVFQQLYPIFKVEIICKCVSLSANNCKIISRKLNIKGYSEDWAQGQFFHFVGI